MSSDSSKRKYALQKVKPKYQLHNGGGIVSAVQQPRTRVITKTLPLDDTTYTREEIADEENIDCRDS
jgi:hypothetical protein